VLILTAVASSALLRPVGRAAAAVLVVAAALLADRFVDEAKDRGAFRLQRQEARYPKVGDFIAGHTPENAIVFAVQHSGSVRYYSGRKTLRWDVLDAAWLVGALDWLRARGFEPYLAIEDSEVDGFRTRFAGARPAALDWPPLAETRSAARVRIFRFSDQEAYRRGRASLPRIF
jgi:hypothetical protein